MPWPLPVAWMNPQYEVNLVSSLTEGDAVRNGVSVLANPPPGFA
jgi:hypothetical protein